MVDSVWGGMPSYITGMFKTRKKPVETPQAPAAIEEVALEEVGSVPTRVQAPAPESRADAIQRGVAGFLGFVPKGGTRGDAADGFANFGRALLGENSVQQMENDYNQSIAPEKLRRALETGDVEAIKRLDPVTASQVQTVDGTTYETGRTKKYDQAVYDGNVDEQRRYDPDAAATRDTERRVGALRVARGALATKNPEQAKAILDQFVTEMPNALTAQERMIYDQGGPEALAAALAEKPENSYKRNLVRGRDNQGNPVYYDPETMEIDPNVTPLDTYSTKEFGPGMFGQFSNFGPGGGPVAAPGVPAPAGDVIGAGFPPPPGTAATPVSAPATTRPRSLTEQVAAAEALVAGSKKTAEQKATMLAELDLKVPELRNKSAAVAARARDVTELTDEDLKLVTGLGNPLQGAGGFTKIHVPGSRAASIESTVSGLEDAVRMVGFQGVKGAGQVTEAESLFAANAIASLAKARQAGPAEYRRETARIQTELNSMMDTAIQQTIMLTGGGERDTTRRSGEETQAALIRENERNDMTPDDPNAIVTVTTVEEARALPPGTKFKTPDGRIKVR